MRAVVVVLALAGCDRLFGLEPIVAAVDASAASAQPCMPSIDTSSPYTYQFTYLWFALSDDATFGIGIDGINRYLHRQSLVMSGSFVLFNAPVQGAFPALTRDGNELFFQEPGGAVVESTYDGAMWALPTPVAGIEPLAAPGSPAYGESAGDLVMVVGETTNTFREYARTNGTWAPTAFAPYTLSDLTDTASASQFGGPSLTADGLVLVFSITTGTDAGIYYVARPSLRVPFDARTGPHSRLLAPPPGSRYFSPQLSASCTQLTVVTDQQAVVRYGQ